MRAEIHDIPLEPINQGVIDCLEGALGLAREGKLSMVAVAAIERDGCPRFYHSEMRNRSLMIGAVARLQHRLLETADEE